MFQVVLQRCRVRSPRPGYPTWFGGGVFRFLLKCSCFAALQLPLFFYVEHRLAAIPTSYTVKRAMMERWGPSADTLITGSSHGFYGITPQCLDGKALNLANNSQLLYHDCALVHAYLSKMPKLKRIIMPVSAFSFEKTLDGTIEKWREDLYFHAFGIRPRSGEWSIRRLSLLATYGGADAIKAIAKLAGPPTMDASGWYARPDPVSITLDRPSGKATAERHGAGLHPEVSEENIQRLVKVIRECQRRNVEVVLITTPFHKCYRDHYDPVAWGRMQAAVQRVRQETNVRYLNFHADERFTDIDFQDADHLNAIGAKKFSTVLNTALQSP